MGSIGTDRKQIATHALKDRDRIANRFGAKEDPGSADDRECATILTAVRGWESETSPPGIAVHFLARSVWPAHRIGRRRGKPIDASPDHVPPCRTMPKAADQERSASRFIAAARWRTSATPKRDEDVVTKPSRQRNVPATPELADALGEVRVSKVPHQADAE